MKVPALKIQLGGANKDQFKIMPPLQARPDCPKPDDGTSQENLIPKGERKPVRKMFPELEIKLEKVQEVMAIHVKEQPVDAEECIPTPPAVAVGQNVPPQVSEAPGVVGERRSSRVRRKTLKAMDADADDEDHLVKAAPNLATPATSTSSKWATSSSNTLSSKDNKETHKKKVHNHKSPIKGTEAHKNKTENRLCANGKKVQPSGKKLATDKIVYQGNQVQVRLKRLSPSVGLARQLVASKSHKTKVKEIIAGLASKKRSLGSPEVKKAKQHANNPNPSVRNHGKRIKLHDPNSSEVPESRTVQLPGTDLKLRGVVVKPNGLSHEEQKSSGPPVVCLEKTLIKDKIYMIAQENGPLRLMMFDGLICQPLYHEFFAAAAARAAGLNQMETTPDDNDNAVITSHTFAENSC